MSGFLPSRSVAFVFFLLLLFVCRLEKERARVKAQAHSDTQTHVQGEVNRILASERAAALDSAQKAVLRERVTAEEERIRTKLLVSLLNLST